MHLELRIYFHLLEMSVSDKCKINECFIEYGFALMVGIAQNSLSVEINVANIPPIKREIEFPAY